MNRPLPNIRVFAKLLARAFAQGARQGCGHKTKTSGMKRGARQEYTRALGNRLSGCYRL